MEAPKKPMPVALTHVLSMQAALAAAMTTMPSARI